MARPQKNVFVLLGKDPNFKKIQLGRIRTPLLKEDPDIATIYFFPQDLSLFSLQKELQNLSLSGRLFIFKNSELLPAEVKTYLAKFLKDGRLINFYIFDFDVEVRLREDLEKDGFFSFLFKMNPPYKIAGAAKSYSLTDLAGALRRNSQEGALIILSRLFKKHKRQKISMQSLGLIVKLFLEVKDRRLKRRYLNHIFETDRLIKEGMLDPHTALEILIIKLTRPQTDAIIPRHRADSVNI